MVWPTARRGAGPFDRSIHSGYRGAEGRPGGRQNLMKIVIGLLTMGIFVALFIKPDLAVGRYYPFLPDPDETKTPRERLQIRVFAAFCFLGLLIMEVALIIKMF